MAKESGSEKDPVALRRKIASSRELVVRDLAGLGYELNFPLKLRKTFQRNTVLWIGGAVALGLLVSLLRARTKKVYVTRGGKKARAPGNALVESGLLLGALKLGATLLQPVISNYVKERLKGTGSKSQSRRW
jgi:hypothetical protein